MSPARDSTPPVGEVLKAPVIQIAAFRCMVLSDDSAFLHWVPSKNHNQYPYVAIGSTHERYNRRFSLGGRPRVELPSIFMAFTNDNALVE